VRVNPRFADLVPGFLNNRRQDVKSMRDAVGRGDFETVQRLGHGMRGAGGSYGFQAITDIGAALEQAGGRRDVDAVRSWLGELSSYLERVAVVAE
jgi:HPt (histidine-containing phosphotransfer) domain-containing protein